MARAPEDRLRTMVDFERELAAFDPGDGRAGAPPPRRHNSGTARLLESAARRGSRQGPTPRAASLRRDGDGARLDRAHVRGDARGAPPRHPDLLRAEAASATASSSCSSSSPGIAALLVFGQREPRAALPLAERARHRLASAALRERDVQPPRRRRPAGSGARDYALLLPPSEGDHAVSSRSAPSPRAARVRVPHLLLGHPPSRQDLSEGRGSLRVFALRTCASAHRAPEDAVVLAPGSGW